jgi:hypothetical protein
MFEYLLRRVPYRLYKAFRPDKRQVVRLEGERMIRNELHVFLPHE